MNWKSWNYMGKISIAKEIEEERAVSVEKTGI